MLLLACLIFIPAACPPPDPLAYPLDADVIWTTAIIKAVAAVSRRKVTATTATAGTIGAVSAKTTMTTTTTTTTTTIIII
jgi:hypothetical protein